RMRVLAGKGRDIEDIAAAPSLHQRDREMAAVEGSAQVGLDGLPPLLARKLFDGLSEVANSGVVDQNVYAFEKALTLVDHHLYLRFASNVANLSRHCSKL